MIPQEQIDKYNKLIAEFLGWSICDEFPSLGNHWIDENCNSPFGEFIVDLKFHKDWNWLMTVAFKIEELDMVEEFSIHKTYTTISAYVSKEKKININKNHTCNGIFYKHEDFFDDKLEATYYAICEFIDWYNKNKEE